SISKQRQRRSPVSCLGSGSLADCHNKPKRDSARQNADESKTGRVNRSSLQRLPAKKGITRERYHREQSEDENSHFDLLWIVGREDETLFRICVLGVLAKLEGIGILSARF